jgi:aryl-alcohol dehydrogenase-like predicted oxidoreductase
LGEPIEKKTIASLASYAQLGRSGLRVSPICLGTLPIGGQWGWRCPDDVARRIFDAYLDAGGNFIDTADGYSRSEELLGQFLSESGRRDRVVVGTKCGMSRDPSDPNAGGNSRKNIRRAVERSLTRLKTDYIDLYWLHAWDALTPVEEALSTLDDLVRAGLVRYIGLSDVPAWYAARAQSLAEQFGRARICALQLKHSLVDRNLEREHVPAALELGMGICSWSPLAMGLLSGKYRRGDKGEIQGNGRLRAFQIVGSQLLEGLSTDRHWAIVEQLNKVAADLDRSPAQVAINWVTRRPGMSSTIISATSLDQLASNLSALEFEIPPEAATILEEASRPDLVFPYYYFQPGGAQRLMHGDVVIRAEPKWFRPQ